jgi:A/G-specific adenine glycosylase
MLIAEKMLQQTSSSHVMKVYDDFFRKFPDLKTLTESNQEEIEQVIKPLGFWRIRARDFKRMAFYLTDMQGKIPSNKEELEKIPGVGSYVSAAMICFCFGSHQAIVDVNVRRVLKRLWFHPNQLPSDKVLETIWSNTIPRGKAKECNWGILDFSAAICTKNPRCSVCFASNICNFYKEQSNSRSKPSY